MVAGRAGTLCGHLRLGSISFIDALKASHFRRALTSTIDSADTPAMSLRVGEARWCGDFEAATCIPCEWFDEASCSHLQTTEGNGGSTVFEHSEGR